MGVGVVAAATPVWSIKREFEGQEFKIELLKGAQSEGDFERWMICLRGECPPIVLNGPMVTVPGSSNRARSAFNRLYRLPDAEFGWIVESLQSPDRPILIARHNP